MSFRELIRFAMPSIIMMIFLSSYTIIDGFFVSHYVGSDAIAALNITYPLTGLLLAIGIMFSTGGSALVGKFLGEFDGISINMAKNQYLALNIQKLSGHCGKLLCCLKYEDDLYSEARKGLPKINSKLKYKDEIYRVASINVLSKEALLDSESGSINVTLDELVAINKKNRNKS